MENTYDCDLCNKSVSYLETKKLLSKRYCSECISIARSERQNNLQKEKVLIQKEKALSQRKKRPVTSKAEREAKPLLKRQEEAKKYSLDAAVENLKNFGAQPLELKFNPLRLKRNEHVYFLSGKEDGNLLSISLALTTQRLFSASITKNNKKSISLDSISLRFSLTNKEHFSRAKLNALMPFNQPSNEKILQVQQGLTTISLSSVIAIETPEHNIDYSVWGIEIHLNQGKNISFFFTNSQGVNSFYTLLSEMVDRLNDPIDNTVFSPKRERIPDEVKIAVWRRDNGCCVRCGSRVNLEYDHIISISKGGSNTLRNIELLCEKCNRIKSNKIV